MVLVKLQGGLDNQMFQYALGRCVSVKNSCRLKLDLSFFQDHPERRYGLDDLSITEQIATLQDCEKLKTKDSKRLNRIKQLYLGKQHTWIREQSLAFDPEYINIKRAAYLDSYWKREKYFESVSQLFRREF